MKRLHRAEDTTDDVYTVLRECYASSKYVCDMCNERMCFECATVDDEDVWVHHSCREDSVTMDEVVGIPLEIVNLN